MNSKCIILFSWFVLLFTACNNNQSSKQQFTIYQEDTIMITFDIDTFNKYKIDPVNKGGIYEYTTEDKVHVEQMDIGEEGYQEKRYYPDSLYYDLFHFYPSGNLRCKGRSFKHGKFPVGRTIYYDELGNITEIEDNDAPYKFTLDEVLKFIEHENIDIRKSKVSISRDRASEQDKLHDEALQNLPVDTYFWGINIVLPERYVREIVLNADNGKVVYDKIPADDYTDEYPQAESKTGNTKNSANARN